jgi:hypothetical protein
MFKKEKIIISTKGENHTYYAKVTNGLSIDFYCSDHHDKPIACIVDFGEWYVFLRTNENHNPVMEKEPFVYGTRWSYGSQRVRLGLWDQTEVKMKTDKTFIFREGDVYADICSSGLTIGFSYENSISLFCRCYVENGILQMQFVEGDSDEA